MQYTVRLYVVHPENDLPHIELNFEFCECLPCLDSLFKVTVVAQFHQDANVILRRKFPFQLHHI